MIKHAHKHMTTDFDPIAHAVYCTAQAASRTFPDYFGFLCEEARALRLSAEHFARLVRAGVLYEDDMRLVEAYKGRRRFLCAELRSYVHRRREMGDEVLHGAR